MNGILQIEAANEIYNEYVLPLKSKRSVKVGVEIEIPILNLNCFIVDHGVVDSIFDDLVNIDGFAVLKRDNDGNIIAVEDRVSKDQISLEYSYNIIEFSLNCSVDINTLSERFYIYINKIKAKLEKHNHTVAGFGLNPFHALIEKACINDSRYNMISSYLSLKANETFLHEFPYFCSMISSVQTHIDIEYENLYRFFNLTDKLEVIKYLLLSNSLYKNKDNEVFYKYRDFLWEKSMFGYNPHNVGNYNVQFSSDNEIIEYYLNKSIHNVVRDNQYIFFHPVKILDYLEKTEITGYYKVVGGTQKLNTITFKPQLDDIKYMRSYKNYELTKRGTVEIRGDCQQPLKDVFSVVAFNIGVYNNLGNIYDFINNYKQLGIFYTIKNSNSMGVKEIIRTNYVEIKAFLFEILNKVTEGLKLRGYSEEKFIECLYERVDVLESPAMKMDRLSESLKMEDIILMYGGI